MNRTLSSGAKLAGTAFGLAIWADVLAEPFINELHYDNAGSDTGEAIELAAAAGTDLSGWSLALYNGNGGAVYNTRALSGAVPDLCGGFGVVSQSYPTNGIQNGAPDGVALVRPDGTVAQFLSYEGALTAADGPAAGSTSTDIGVSEASSTPAGFSLQLGGSGQRPADFTWAGPATASFGQCNPDQVFEGGADSAPAVTRVSPVNGANNVALDAVIAVEFSEPVAVSQGALALACDGADIPAALGGRDASYTLTPSAGLPEGASCRLTIAAAGVADQDGTPQSLAADFSSTFDTSVDPGQCGDPAVLISAVQGSGESSPLAGDIVTVEGVVVGDFTGAARLDGFFMQEEAVDEDADTATSEGVFVFYDPAAANTAPGAASEIATGEAVRVTGEVAEFFGLTELTNVRVQRCGAGGAVAAAVLPLPLSDPKFPERLEGMLVDLEGGLTVTENFNQARFGEVVLSSGRLFQPTQVAAPGAPQAVVELVNALDQIILDDGRNGQNREPVLNPDGSELTATETTRAGTVVRGTAVMGFSFGAYRLQPVALELGDENPRTAGPSLPGSGSLKVASFNVLNYFTTIDAGMPVCGPAADLGCRGADSLDELERQQGKLVAALAAIDADIVGLIEVENDGTDEDSSLANLVQALNSSGAGPYSAVNAGMDPVGDDAIQVALIYKPASVMLAPGSSVAVLDDSVLPSLGLASLAPLFNGDATNRAAIAATFTEKASGESLTVSVNHFKSKGASGLDDADGDCEVLGPAADPNCDQDDGQGYWNTRRTQAAQALAAWLDTDPTSGGDFDALILGDLNAYAKEDPIEALKGAGYSDLVNELSGEDAYSFVFFARYGTLDYAMANAGAALQVTGIDEWHINSDEPRIIDYNEEFKSDAQILTLYSADAFRASDHDPLVVEMQLESAAAALKGLARAIARTDVDAFEGRNRRVRFLRRTVLYKRTRLAAIFVELGFPRAAFKLLGHVIARIDDAGPRTDWIKPSDVQTALLERASVVRDRIRFEAH